MVKSGWTKICRKVVKVLNLEERKLQLLFFFGFMGMWFHFASISDQKPPVALVPEDLFRVT